MHPVYWIFVKDENSEGWTKKVEKEALKHFRNCVVKGLDMLAVRFDLEMVEEVNHMIQPELQHLLRLAKQWADKPTEKVSLRSLLKIIYS